MLKITLAAARVNAKLKQTYAAGRLGVSVATLRNWECGKSFPNQPQIEQLCELYGIDYDCIDFGR